MLGFDASTDGHIGVDSVTALSSMRSDASKSLQRK